MSVPPAHGPPGRRWKIALLGGIALAAAAVAAAVPPFTRPPSYYDFADRRELFGVPNFWDVVSNAPWIVVGLLSLAFVARTRSGDPDSPFADDAERVRFGVLFAGVLLIPFGSAYFHLAPAPATLVWDRLPMTIAFMALFSIVIGERIDLRAGRVLLVALLALGIGSVVYWHRTELAGRGDERLYGLVQFFPMLAIPLVVLLFPNPSVRTRDLWLVLIWYGLAKVFEIADKVVFAGTGGAVSGHTLKHLCGVLATVWMFRMMRLRRPLA